MTAEVERAVRALAAGHGARDEDAGRHELLELDRRARGAEERQGDLRRRAFPRIPGP